MIANARMYAVTPDTARRWGDLFRAVFAAAGVPAGTPVTVLEHVAPAPLEDLWTRTDQGAVFMCGLPFARATPQPIPVAAPIMSLPACGGQPRYWSCFAVRADGPHRRIEDTFGGRLALTVPDSQSGCVAALTFLQPFATSTPLFDTVIGPTITPLGALTAVIRGAADLAPIDCYAWALLEHARPDLTAKIRILAETAPTPNPPLVASPGTLTPAALDALAAAFQDAHRRPATQELMAGLLLQRFVRPTAAAYQSLRTHYEAALQHWRSVSLARIIDPAFARFDAAIAP